MRRRHSKPAADAHGLPSLTIEISRVIMANRPKTVSQALLFVEILALLPTRRWMGLTEIHSALALKGVSISKLSLQRAMKTLREAEDFEVECDQRARPFGYRLRARPAFADFGRIVLRPDAALLLKLVDIHLRGFLPGHILTALEPHFEAAERCLAVDDPACRRSTAWLSKVSAEPSDPPFPTVRIAPRIFHVVSESLFFGRKLEIACGQTSRSTESFVVSPLGLVHGNSPFLVCRPDIGDGLRRIELARIRDARMLVVPVAGDEAFSIHEYLRSAGAGGTGRAPP